MSMKPLETIFFIPRQEEYEGKPYSIIPDPLLEKAGAVNLQPNPPTPLFRYFRWAGWDGCRGALVRFRFHDLLYIFFSENQVYETMEEEKERGERPDLANLTDAFETACIRLQANAALIFRSWGYGDEEELESARTMALHEIDAEIHAKSVTTLMKQAYAAFYLNDELAQTVELPWGINEVHALEPGYVVFRGDFETRWIWSALW